MKVAELKVNKSTFRFYEYEGTKKGLIYVDRYDEEDFVPFQYLARDIMNGWYDSLIRDNKETIDRSITEIKNNIVEYKEAVQRFNNLKAFL